MFNSLSTCFFVLGIQLLLLRKINAYFQWDQLYIDEKPHLRCTSESKYISACIHEYLEKDFISISPIVYPKTKVHVTTTNSQCIKFDVFQKKNVVLLDGPTLQNSCNDLYQVLDCLKRELHFCTSIESFFQLRHLVYSLKKILIWLCESKKSSLSTSNEIFTDENMHTNLRERFLVLLESIQCIECIRTDNPTCQNNVSSVLADVSFWHNVLRLKLGMEKCDDLKIQVNCLHQNEVLEKFCGSKASMIHRNLSSLFIKYWCDSAPFKVYSLNQSDHKISDFYSILVIIFILLIFLNI